LEGGTVSIIAEIRDSALVMSIANPVDADRPRGHGTGFGLNLVRQRLQVYYGASYVFAATETDGVYRAEIHVPLAAGDSSA
jgi:LytS/YehU family sensor histidine kinase